MKCGVELENFVYYKDDTHYFVMTVKKHSLLRKGILKEDRPNTRDLLAPDNRDNSKLKQFALEIADFTTQHRIPNITFALNHHGEEDIAMFDFTSRSMANHSCFVKKRHDRTLIQAIVGDSLLEVKLSNFPGKLINRVCFCLKNRKNYANETLNHDKTVHYFRNINSCLF